MNQIDVAWAQHLSLNVTQICYCLQIYNANTNLYLTDHDRNVVLNGQTFIGDAELAIEPVKFAVNLADDQFEMSSHIQDDLISFELLAVGFLDEAQFKLHQVNWHEPNENRLVKIGKVGEFKLENSEVKIKLHGLAKPLEYQKGRLLQEKCDAHLGDERCGVNLNLAEHFGLGQVVQIYSKHSFEISTAANFATGYFDGGNLQWLTGGNVNIGQVKPFIQGQVKQLNDNHLIDLLHLSDLAISVGDELKLFVGCDKSFVTCQEKFANAAAYRGFDQMPGKNFELAYPQRSLLET